MQTDINPKRIFSAAALAVLLIAAAPARAEGSWPDLAVPAKAIGGGENDAAIVVGAWSFDAAHFRAARRGFGVSGDRYDALGFRPARSR